MRIKNLVAVGFLCSLSWMAQAQAAVQNQSAKLSRKEANKLAGRVIDQFFPADVVQDRGEEEDEDNPGPPEKNSCGYVYQVDQKGNPELIFAMYPGNPGRFLALKRGTDGVFSAQDVAPTGFKADNRFCEMSIEKINLRGDVALVVSLGDRTRFSQTFIFQWDGAQMTSLGPTEMWNGSLATRLTSAYFQNIFGGDSLAVLSADEFTYDGRMYQSVYALENGRYVLKLHACYSQEFRVGSGRSSSTTEDFSLVDESQGPYAIQIANGDLDGSHRVSDVEISLNGKRVISQGEINGQIGIYHVDIDGLKRTGNTLTVKVAGAPGASIYMVVEDKKPASDGDSSRQQ